MNRQRPLATDRDRPHPARRGSGRRLWAGAALALLASLALGTPPAMAASQRLS